MEIAFLFGLVTLLLFGIADGIAAIPARKVSPIAITFLIDVTSAVLFGSLSYFFWSSYVWNWWLLLPVMSGFSAYLGFLMYTYAIRDGSVGVSAAIGNSYPLLATLFGFVVLGEFLSDLKLVAVATILVGVFLISFKPKEWNFKQLSKHNHAVIYALLAMLFWTGQVVFMDYSTNHFPPYQVTHIIATSALLLSSAVYFLSGNSFSYIKQIPISTLGVISSLSVMYFIGVFAFNYSLSVGELGVYAAVAGASPFVSALFAYVFFRERLQFREWLAIIVVVIGLVILGFAV